MWFKNLTGFSEISRQHVHANLTLIGENLYSSHNGKTYACGSLSIPCLLELRQASQVLTQSDSPLSIQEIIADAQSLHIDKNNAGSLFQVASQFNLLEMPSPDVSPDKGIDDYEYDPTQGPACAIAAGAGTIYRNYFIPTQGEKGQSSTNQIDTLYDLGKALGNENNKLWTMQNGYALASVKGLQQISKTLSKASEIEIDQLRQLLRIGIQSNTEVTLSNSKHKVTQAYCSALPVAYSQATSQQWQAFASLILEASYEATLCAGIINAHKTGNNKVFLTLLGGGAFGNETAWIINAMKRALLLHKDSNLNVYIVSHNASNDKVRELIKDLRNEPCQRKPNF